LDDAKRTLDDLDAKLAAFKKQYVGQLPGDAENNLKILMGLNSQLDSNTQTLNRAHRTRPTPSLFWRSSGGVAIVGILEQSTNSGKAIVGLESQLAQLQARYTDDHPDVIKTKGDIADSRRN